MMGKEIVATENSFLEIVSLIKTARQKTFAQANSNLLELYWNVGKHISEKIKSSAWGSGVVKELAAFIAKTEPDIKGFSDKNLWRMKQFYEAYSSPEILSTLSRVLASLSWSNISTIITRCKSAEEREFYIKKCASEHYTFRELDRQIDSSLYERTVTGKLLLSGEAKKLDAKKELSEVFRDSYVFEFLNLPKNYSEKTLQKNLVAQMKDFILELGKDFLFVGEEFRVQVGSSDFFIDLVFFHRGLQCLVAFELKTEKFKPDHIGQLDFYLEALDRDVKKQNENPSIGILLCKDKDDEVVEYALSRSLSPAMVAEYETQLPDKKLLKAKLHEIAELAEQEEEAL